jgi:hypothetical protein
MGNNARIGLNAAGCNACQSHTTYSSKTVSYYSTSGALDSNGYSDAEWFESVFSSQRTSFFHVKPGINRDQGGISAGRSAELAGHSLYWMRVAG